MNTIHESARDVPVIHDADVCIVGGSCTGVFAAVAAARLGCSVALIESSGFFGGVATAGLVNIWHSTHDTEGTKQIIAGLTTQTIERLAQRNAVTLHEANESKYVEFNSPELVLVLDEMVCEQAAIRPLLHTRFSSAVVEDGRVTHAIIEDKSGRRAIRARMFIDASGDGDLLARAGLPLTTRDHLQPPTTCAILLGMDQVRKRNPGFNLAKAVYDPKIPDALRDGFLWHTPVAGFPEARMVAGTRVHGADCSDADDLTRAEIVGRRQVRVMQNILREHYKGGHGISLAGLPSYIGIRETRQADALYELTEQEVLDGVRFPDAIANGSYRVDVHYPDKPGITFRYQDGREVYIQPGKPNEESRWREETEDNPTFYQVPYRSLVPKGSQNVLVAGRLMDADRGAYGAVRVMVNCNQTGEAAGTACALALDTDTDVADVNTDKLRKTLANHGALVI